MKNVNNAPRKYIFSTVNMAPHRRIAFIEGNNGRYNYNHGPQLRESNCGGLVRDFKRTLIPLSKTVFTSHEKRKKFKSII